jgi:hypothetical protein
MAETSANADEAFRIADALVAKPLAWSRSVPSPSDSPVLTFVKFRAFDRAVKGYSSFVQLLKSGQWEDALVLASSLYELNVNLSAIEGSPDPEQAAKTFLRFGKFQLLRLEQRRLQDQLRDEKLAPQRSAQAIDEFEQDLAEITSTMERDFAEFRKPKGKGWLDSWSGLSVETLAQRLAKETGGHGGQSDYYVFRLASLFAHNTPGALFLRLPPDRETADWNDFRTALDEAGHKGLRKFLYEASMCFVDVVGMAGDSIAGYERQWFDEFALPLLDEF